MAKRKTKSREQWFQSCCRWPLRHDVTELRKGIESGKINEQDEYGMTALSLAVMSGWHAGVEELLQAGADTELRYFRTGETSLYMAVQQRNIPIIDALVLGGANPDAPNYWRVTPRDWATRMGLKCFDRVPACESPLPQPRIQNAEHLAEHYYPHFKIPELKERETMQVGQAVDVYVYGPKSETKQDTVKVRITSLSGTPPYICYYGEIETPIKRTHLTIDNVKMEFGPQNIATVYLSRPQKEK